MNVVLNLSGKWKRTPELIQLGCIHDFDKHQEALASSGSIKEWAETLKKLTGFYALVKQENNRVFASVDHIRSNPLFYAITEHGFFLSDSAEWVRQQAKETVMDEYAKAEFQLTGYVTGHNTLYKNVKQLQAGECLVYADNKIEVERYYSFEHSEPDEYDEKALLAELDTVARESIQRLISYANGRQIVLPLSGGYDSRLIAALLKEADYENILTFTYGVKGNKEAAYSKIVAENLGLKWHFIEYTEALWKDAWKTDERKRYQLEASNWTSLAHMQDWLAVKVMKEQGNVDNNAVFAPGHSGDMVAGSHIPSFIHENLSASYTRDELIGHLFSKHYSLTKHENVHFPVSIFKEEIEKTLLVQQSYSAKEFANECERHNWQNRQAKFIFNSVRVYEFFDYDWWIPLWDKEFVGFFEGLPLPLRNHHWYKEYVKRKYLKYSIGTEAGNVGNASEAGLVKKVASMKLLEKTRLRPVLEKLYRLVIKSKTLTLREAVYNSAEVARLYDLGYSSNGRAAYFFIEEFCDG